MINKFQHHSQAGDEELNMKNTENDWNVNQTAHRYLCVQHLWRKLPFTAQHMDYHF